MEQRRLPDHETGRFEGDLGLGQRMRNPLMRADRPPPDLALACVGARLLQRVAADARAERRRKDPLRVEPVERHAQTVADVPEKAVGVDDHVIEEQLPLLLGRLDDRVDRLAREARRIDVDDEDRKAPAAGLRHFAGLRKYEHRLRVLKPRDVGLHPLQAPHGTLLRGPRAHAMGVGACIGLGHGERIVGASVSQARQPTVPLGRRAMTGENRARNRR
ncbi:unannotated protein [freshwater metagenome]|uniref:Unannotated protein n=1 Tax=freshwater metagenome TaxID=449393 RepID=A0A6J7E6T8_9ZZZZ